MLRITDLQQADQLNHLVSLLQRYQLELTIVEEEQAIPGTFWGEPEAGLIANRVYVRPDTPLHSLFHESCHYICMDDKRRKALHTNAKGTTAEENAVCYLQILLAKHLQTEIPALNQNSMMKDMDDWGYSFRLGSTQGWFEADAEDARDWLLQYAIIDHEQKPTFQLRY